MLVLNFVNISSHNCYMILIKFSLIVVHKKLPPFFSAAYVLFSFPTFWPQPVSTLHVFSILSEDLVQFIRMLSFSFYLIVICYYL